MSDATRQHLPRRPRSGGPTRWRGPLAALQLSRPTPGTASSAASTGADRSAPSSTSRARRRDLRRRAGADHRPGDRLPRAGAGDACASRGRQRSSACRSDAGAVRGVMTRLGLAFRSEPGLIHVTPPSWRFDLAIEEDLIEEVIRVIGYANLPDTPPLARSSPAASESTRSVNACGIVSPRATTTRRSASASSRSAGARAGGQRRAGARAQPDREPAGGDALVADRQPGRRAALQPRAQGRARAPVRGRARVPARRRSRAGCGCRPRSAAAAPACLGPADGRSGASANARSTSSTSRATSRPCSRRCAPASSPPRIRRCIPGAAPRWNSMDSASASSANCTRAGARPTNCRRRPCCSSSTPPR